MEIFPPSIHLTGIPSWWGSSMPWLQTSLHYWTACPKTDRPLIYFTRCAGRNWRFRIPYLCGNKSYHIWSKL